MLSVRIAPPATKQPCLMPAVCLSVCLSAATASSPLLPGLATAAAPRPAPARPQEPRLLEATGAARPHSLLQHCVGHLGWAGCSAPPSRPLTGTGSTVLP